MASREVCVIGNPSSDCTCMQPPPELPPRPVSLGPTTASTPSAASSISPGPSSEPPTQISSERTGTEPSGITPTTGTAPEPKNNQGLIIGLSVGLCILAIIAIVLIIWWLYKQRKLCFKNTNSSDGSVASSMHKDVELLSVRKGTLILQPSPPPPPFPSNEIAPTMSPVLGDNAPNLQDSRLTPVEPSTPLRTSVALTGSSSLHSKQAEGSTTPQQTTQAAAQGSKPKKKKKSKRNQVSPEGTLPAVKGPSPPP